MTYEEIIDIYRQFDALPFPKSIILYDSNPANRDKMIMVAFPYTFGIMQQYVDDQELTAKNRELMHLSLHYLEQARDIQDADGKQYLEQTLFLIRAMLESPTQNRDTNPSIQT